MNARQLNVLGVPESFVPQAIQAIQAWHSNMKQAPKAERKHENLKDLIKFVVSNPDVYLQNNSSGPFRELAQSLIEDRAYVRPEPISYQIWGKEGIDPNTFSQMEQACSLPVAAGAALMPDAHVGYGLPIGGVLALRNAVCPYAVGVDIACRMKVSILDLPVNSFEKQHNLLREAIEGGTRFGVGSVHEHRQDHAVMDQDWGITKVTRENKDKAWKQLGTSGSGNHFVEFGLCTLYEGNDLGIPAGDYVGLMSHSGSRGAGSSVCSVYSGIAQANLPPRFKDCGRLAWLSMDTEAGQEYWAAMNLMGDYAAANHDVIHRLVSKLSGGRIIAGLENHHNFAWIEEHNGEKVYVHRKGATPAGLGVLGVIPGSMGDPAFLVRGRGNPLSLNSASHGAGRVMSRRQACDKYNFKAVQGDLAARGIVVLSAGADEVPGVYKPIREVMAAQADLVEAIGEFHPRLVKMSADGKAED